MLKLSKLRFVKGEHLSNGNNGWKLVSSALCFISNPKGTNCHEWLDKALKEKIIEGDWSGMLHNPIAYPDEYPLKYKEKVIPISELVRDPYFLQKLKDCKALFVFTKQVQEYVKSMTGFENVFLLKHPSGLCYSKRQWVRFDRLMHVGQQMRKYHSFLNLRSSSKKLMIHSGCDSDMEEMKIYKSSEDDKTEYIKKVSLEKYVDLMCSSVIFLDLYDVAACNTILECISLSVPILVNRLDGCMEYLGRDYPLYYDDLEDAERKISDQKKIDEANEYLKGMEKRDLTIDFFIKSLMDHMALIL